jgi:hypothetical protein
MSTQTSSVESISQLRTVPALRPVKWLVGAYLILSMLTVVAIITFSDIAPNLVIPQAWVRGIIVAATSILTFIFANRAATGNPRALLRLRIVVAVILIALVAVLCFLPLPLWMFIEQVACGALLLATAVIIFRPSTERSGPLL